MTKLSKVDSPRDEAETQNFGPHRRPMFVLGPPAIVLNLGFWNPYLQEHREELKKTVRNNSKKTADDTSLHDRRLLWSQQIDEFLCELLNHLHAQPWVLNSTALVRDKNKPNLIDSFSGGIDRNETRPPTFQRGSRENTPAKFDVVLFEFKLAENKLQLHLLAERRHEYWTLAFCLSLNPFAEPDVSNVAAPAPNKVAPFFEGLLAVWDDLRLTEIPGDDPASFWRTIRTSPANPKHKTRAQLAYDVCVNQFDDFVNDLIKTLITKYNIGHPYARFVGNLFWLPYDREGNPLSREELADAEKRFSAPESPRRDFEPTTYPKDASVLRKLWPLILQMQGRTLGRPPLDGRDIIACYFLNRRALYASSLAKVEHSDDPRPPRVVFSMFLAMEDRWQIGRLVDRLFCCGSARLAAMREFHLVLNAGDTLHVVEDKLFTIGIDGFTQDVRDEIEEKFGEIDSDFVEYRVERVQHYWEQFHSLHKGLRERRIEGFQPYGQFVARRLGGSVNLVGSIGRLHQLTRAEVDLRYQIEQTTNLVRLQEKLVRLQRVGEVFATISIAYYISSWLAGWLKSSSMIDMCTLFNWIARTTKSREEALCQLQVSLHYTAGATVAVLLYLSYHVYRQWRKRKKENERASRRESRKAGGPYPQPGGP